MRRATSASLCVICSMISCKCVASWQARKWHLFVFSLDVLDCFRMIGFFHPFSPYRYFFLHNLRRWRPLNHGHMSFLFWCQTSLIAALDFMYLHVKFIGIISLCFCSLHWKIYGPSNQLQSNPTTVAGCTDLCISVYVPINASIGSRIVIICSCNPSVQYAVFFSNIDFNLVLMFANHFAYLLVN